MKKGLFFLLIISFVGLCAYLFMAFYDAAEKTAIRQLNEEQQIHAQQASHGIEDFFKTWTGILGSFSKMDEIISVDADGQRYMTLFYEAHQEQIRSITRVDERGRILHTVPYGGSEGSDISGQKHMRDILRDHKPVVSDVFRTVQGFDGVALHVPVFKGATFKGTIAIVIDFENLARRYLEVIKIGKTGYAWVVSRDGTTLYSPVPGFTGKSVFDNCGDYPVMLAMAKEMLRGHQGTATYTFDRIGEKTVAPVKKYAVYMPINIVNTFWSIVVASAEDEVLSSLASFRNRLLLVIAMILFGGVLFSIISAKAWLIVAEEEKRKRAEAELRESEQRFRAIFDAANDAFFIHDLETGAILDVNRKMCEMYGLSREEALRSDVGAISSGVPPYTQEEAVGWVRKAIAGDPQIFEWHAKDHAGRLFWVEVNMRRAAIGPAERIIVSVRDITERKQAEERLLRSKEVLRIFVEHSPAAIAMFDHDMKYLVASRRFLIDYNLGDQDIIGRSHYEVFPEISEGWREIHRRCLAGEVEKAGEDPFPRADGKMDWVRWEIRPWHETQGEIGGIILLSEVITERKQAELELERHREHLEDMVKERTTALQESQRALLNIVEDLNLKTEELEQANAKLQELDRLKSMFIASMSHELRTPLNSIIGFSGIMLQGMTGEINSEQRDQLERVFRAGKHLLSLITDVIDIAKIESGRIVPFSEDFQLHDLVDEAVGQVRQQAESKGLAMDLSLPEYPVVMHTDRRRLLQCLLNFLSNAVKFSEKGMVAIEVVEMTGTEAEGTEGQRAREEKYLLGVVEISVRDTGIGIRKKDMEQLFGSFVRFESHLKTTTPGTGLGLYLTKKLATEVLGGEVGAESEEGRGSRFWIRVPVILSDRETELRP